MLAAPVLFGVSFDICTLVVTRLVLILVCMYVPAGALLFPTAACTAGAKQAAPVTSCFT